MIDTPRLSIEELRKKVKEKTDLIKKNITLPKNPIDKLTSMDELLRENIIAQRDLTNITHKLLLAIYYKEGDDDSITPNGVDTTAILEGLKGGDDYRTLNPILNNVIVNDNKEIFNVEGSGIIDVIKIISSTSSVNNKDFSVRIRCDTTILYANTWTELETRTPNERGMVCFEDVANSEYVLIFKTIAYSKGFIIEIYDSNATLNTIQVKYHEKV